MPKSREILMFVCNRVAKSHEILMFVCLQKDAKQCCDTRKLNRSHCAGQQHSPNNAVTPESSMVLIVLVKDIHQTML